jgi:hypothetical protein
LLTERNVTLPSHKPTAHRINRNSQKPPRVTTRHVCRFHLDTLTRISRKSRGINLAAAHRFIALSQPAP